MPPAKKPRALCVSLVPSMSNDLVRLAMRSMRQARAGTTYQHVVCTIGGFHADPRELWDIPEARAFCRRLVTLGFISYLDATTTFSTVTDPTLRAALGAAEIWLMSEGRLRAGLVATPGLLDELERTLAAANAAANAVANAVADAAG